jgi:hypothetical protein
MYRPPALPDYGPHLTSRNHALMTGALLGMPYRGNINDAEAVDAYLRRLVSGHNLPTDFIGQLCWRFPALRRWELFNCAFGTSFAHATLDVRLFRSSGLPHELWGNIWGLACVLVDAIAAFGTAQLVDDWLSDRNDPLGLDCYEYLASPVGRDLLRAALRDLCASKSFGKEKVVVLTASLGN